MIQLIKNITYNMAEKEYIIVDADGNEVRSKSIEAIKVCGITFSDNEELAYEKNITDKIMKLENQIKRWLWEREIF